MYSIIFTKDEIDSPIYSIHYTYIIGWGVTKPSEGHTCVKKVNPGIKNLLSSKVF